MSNDIEWMKRASVTEAFMYLRASSYLSVQEALNRIQEALDQKDAISSELLAACQAALQEAKERDEDLGYNCWPQIAAAIARATGSEPAPPRL